jgi:hypothetical protein
MREKVCYAEAFLYLIIYECARVGLAGNGEKTLKLFVEKAIMFWIVVGLVPFQSLN